MRLIDADATISRLRADESFICVGDKNKAIQDVMDMPSVMQNATNGDVIKAMFPQAFFDDYVNQWDEVESVVMDNEIYFDLDWWNAPYKTESEEKE